MAGNGQSLVPYSTNQWLVHQNGKQQPVIYGADQPADSHGGSQQILYNNARNLSAALAGTGRPFLYIHNEGRASFTDTYQPDCNTICYNGPSSSVSFSGSGSGSKTYYWYHRCGLCKEVFDSKEEFMVHQENSPRFCKRHQMCLASWTEHVNRYAHTKCPVPGYSREYRSDVQFLEHFRRRHY